MKTLYVLLPALYFLALTFHYKPMNFMTEEKLIATVRPKLEAFVKTPWAKIVFRTIKEDEFGSESFTVWKNNTDHYNLYPDVYRLDEETQDALSLFIQTRKTPCNGVDITLYPDQTYVVELIWNKEDHEANKRMLAAKAEREKTKLHTDLTDTPIDYNRFKQVPSNNATERFNDFDFDGPIICAFFVRLYAMLGDSPSALYEGFTYNILDTEQDYSFSAALTASGPCYYTTDRSKKAMKAVQDFHDMVFSKHLALKDCTFTYEHDFGSSTMRYKDGKMICN